jgi:glycosyltransferase involved in cell wall biosynthesis
MPKISAIIITYNEEKNIRRCLSSIEWVDEIVVIDSKSEDGTVSLAQEYTSKVFTQEWLGFARQKEFARRQASFEWILNIDADEVVTPELAQEIRKKMNASPEIDGFWIRRRSKFLGRWIEHAWQPDWVLRLFRKEKGFFGEEQVHEGVIIKGKTARLKGMIEHYPFVSLTHNLKKLDHYTTLSASQMMQKGKSGILLKLFFSPVLSFFKTYVLKQGFRDGIPGLILSGIRSFYVFTKYAKYWELKNKKEAMN